MSYKIGMTFPGGGAQTVGMLDEMADKFPIIKETFAEASQVLGYDLWELASKGPAEKQEIIEFTLPLMLASNVSLYRCWIENKGPKPALMAGHSLGEYSALVCAEALAFKDAVKLVQLRGQLMQAAVPAGQGAMGAIIGLDDKSIQQLCEEAAQGEILSPANYNSPGQVVIAGNTAAVNRALEIAKAKKVQVAKLLPVSIPSHCELMRPVAIKLKEYLDATTISVPQIPILHNYDLKPHEDADTIRKALIEQLTIPVRWVETIREMERLGVTNIIECGPGKTLFGMIKWITKKITPHSINPVDFMEDNLALFASQK